MASLHSALGDHLDENIAVNRRTGPSSGAPDISKVDWSWPPWCLNQRSGYVEVLVIDDEMGKSFWLPGIAMTRVVDPAGKDAYLHVQYVWEDEEYVEDFPPARVRRVGDLQTCEDLIRSGQLSGSGGNADTDRGYHPARAAASPPGDQDIAEVILEVIEADGINIRRLPPEQCAIALEVKPPAPPSRAPAGLYAKIGRQHQPDFFERLVPNKDALSSISRSHFELTWEPAWRAPKLRQLSRNKLLVDSQLCAGADTPPMDVPDGTRLAFIGGAESDAPFLTLRVNLRSRGVVQSSGEHPAVRATQQQQLLGNNIPITMQMHARPIPSVAAVLECVRSSGTDLNQLTPDVKAIPLEFEKLTDIGRTHQVTVFEELLKAEPKWLSFISRTHCKVRLTRDSAGGQAHILEVENLSANVLFVTGQPLSKGDRTSIVEGGAITFAACTTGDENKFLEFVLRRARLAA